jgi:hypothetical protein
MRWALIHLVSLHLYPDSALALLAVLFHVEQNFWALTVTVVSFDRQHFKAQRAPQPLSSLSYFVSTLHLSHPISNHLGTSLLISTEQGFDQLLQYCTGAALLLLGVGLTVTADRHG